MWIRRLSELLLVAAIGLLAGPASGAPSTGGDPFADYRERFKQGMDRYQAGAFTEAIGYWEPIYGELGEQKGYRLAYNLGVAYQELGEATRAAEHLQSFLAQVDARSSHGEAQPAIVEREASDAKDRIAALTTSRGRIHVDPGNPPRAVQVDAMAPRLAAFVAWVSPGKHSVTFAAGTPAAESTELEVHAGELVEVAPYPAPAAAPAPIAAPPAPRGLTTPAAARSLHLETVHPLPPALLWVGGALTLAAGGASIALESNAWSLHDRYAKESPIPPGDAASFDTARGWAYGGIGTTLALGAITAGLLTWYFAGTTEREVRVAPGGVAARF